MDVCDSDGVSPLFWAIRMNKTPLVKFILQGKSSNGLNLGHVNSKGRSAAHVVVQPYKAGSFENTQILNMLRDNGFALDARDVNGKTPLDLALQQESGVMAAELRKLLVGS